MARKTEEVTINPGRYDRRCLHVDMLSERAIPMSYRLIRLIRFPVPQDNFVPVATSSKCLVGCLDTDSSLGSGADPES